MDAARRAEKRQELRRLWKLASGSQQGQGRFNCRQLKCARLGSRTLDWSKQARLLSHKFGVSTKLIDVLGIQESRDVSSQQFTAEHYTEVSCSPTDTSSNAILCSETCCIHKKPSSCPSQLSLKLQSNPLKSFLLW